LRPNITIGMQPPTGSTSPLCKPTSLQIASKWEAGVLQKHGLQRSEVEGLLRALFEDTQLRDEALARLAAAAGPE
jgi:hypothetical protein